MVSGQLTLPNHARTGVINAGSHNFYKFARINESNHNGRRPLSQFFGKASTLFEVPQSAVSEGPKKKFAKTGEHCSCNIHDRSLIEALAPLPLAMPDDEKFKVLLPSAKFSIVRGGKLGADGNFKPLPFLASPLGKFGFLNFLEGILGHVGIRAKTYTHYQLNVSSWHKITGMAAIIERKSFADKDKVVEMNCYAGMAGKKNFLLSTNLSVLVEREKIDGHIPRKDF